MTQTKPTVTLRHCCATSGGDQQQYCSHSWWHCNQLQFLLFCSRTSCHKHCNRICPDGTRSSIISSSSSSSSVLCCSVDVYLLQSLAAQSLLRLQLASGLPAGCSLLLLHQVGCCRVVLAPFSLPPAPHHSSIHPSIHPCIHPSNHSLVLSFIHPFIPSFVHSFIHPFNLKGQS